MVYLHPKTLEVMKSMRYIADSSVSDFFFETRTWKDRLFTRPWTPWQRYKTHYCPRGYVNREGTIFVSPRTKAILDNMP